MLLRNRKEESDCSESFEVCLSLITVVRNMFIKTKIQLDGISVNISCCKKRCDFLK